MHNDMNESGSGSPTDRLDELLRSASWPDEASDRLDELLRMAEWPEAMAQPQVKVERSWMRFAYAAAVAVLVGLTLWGLSIDRRPLAPTGVRIATPPVTERQTVSGTKSTPRDSRRPAEPPAIGDTPIMLPARSPALAPGELRFRMLLTRSLPTAASETDEAIHRFLAHRIAQPNGDLATLIEPFVRRRTEVERRLLDCFGRLSDAQEVAAIELLSHIGSEASVPLLLRMRSRTSTHEPAIRALLELADARTLSRLLRSEADSALRDDIAEAIRARNDQRTLLFTLATQGEPLCRERGSVRLRSAESF